MTFPVEIMQYHICPYLHVKDIGSLCFTCKDYFVLDELYPMLIERDFSVKSGNHPKNQYHHLRRKLETGEKFKIVIEVDIDDPLFHQLMKTGRVRIDQVWDDLDTSLDDELLIYQKELAKKMCSGKDLVMFDPKHVQLLNESDIVSNMIDDIGQSATDLFNYEKLAGTFNHHSTKEIRDSDSRKITIQYCFVRDHPWVKNMYKHIKHVKESCLICKEKGMTRLEQPVIIREELDDFTKDLL